MFFSWLSPGPGSGYIFVVANVTSMALLLFFATTISGILTSRTTRWPHVEELQFMIVIGWGYLVAYLGVGLIVITALRRFATVTMLASVLINFLLLLAGFGIPYAIKSMSIHMRDMDYSFLQIF